MKYNQFSANDEKEIFNFIRTLQEISGNPVIFGPPQSKTDLGEPYVTFALGINIAEEVLADNPKTDITGNPRIRAVLIDVCEEILFEKFLECLKDNKNPITLRTLPQFKNESDFSTGSLRVYIRIRLHQENFKGVIKPEGEQIQLLHSELVDEVLQRLEKVLDKD